jgi:hypothetical protein
VSPAAVLLLLHAEMYRSGVENWPSFGNAARVLAARLIAGEV